jgi:hypothetical protein
MYPTGSIDFFSYMDESSVPYTDYRSYTGRATMVPLPGSALLLGASLLRLAGARLRRRRAGI